MVSEVVYLGHKIDKQGLHPLAEKVETVQAAPGPKNVSELKSYLGLLSYYGTFLPNLFATLAPIYNLLKSTVKWKWTHQESSPFCESKKLLSSTEVLAHFNPTKEVILACGAIISHKMPDGTEHLVGFSSRTLSSAEKNYSQLEIEGLVCVFEVKKFHTYLPLIYTSDRSHASIQGTASHTTSGISPYPTLGSNIGFRRVPVAI